MISKMKTNALYSFIAILVFITPYSEQYGSGAPPKACITMLPSHGNTTPQTSPPPYVVTTLGSQVKQGTGINVTISSPIRTSIGGFLLQARSVQDPDKIVGTWSNLPSLARLTSCGTDGNSATHTNPEAKPSLTFTWNAPTDFLESVFFRATVAENYNQYWSKIESHLVEVVTPDTSINNPTPEASTHSTLETKYPFETTTNKPVKTSNPFYMGCGSTKLCFGSSSTCIADQNCVAAVAVVVEGDKYTFELLGTDNAAYVAVGLSDDNKMGGDSVIECVRNNNRISTHASWTFSPSSNARPKCTREEVPQNIFTHINSSAVDGYIYCKFTRDSQSTIRGVDFDLVNNKYHLLLASGNSASPQNVEFHDKIYISSDSKVSLAEVGNLAGASKVLLRLHGAFMLIAWIGTSSCGILMARYYRQTWVGKQLGGKDIWFAWHRVLMVTTWCLTMAAFVIIIIEVGGISSTKENPHAILGIITVVLCFLQPIGAFFRPHPGTVKRPIFNWTHWLIGNTAHIFGIVTVFFAVYLNKAELPEWMMYILVAFVVFHVLMHLILSLAVCVSDGRISNGRVNSFPMKDLMTNTRQAVNNDRKTDAPHSAFRKFLLGIYLFVIIVLVIVLVCIICLAPIEETYQSVTKAISGSMNKN